MYYKLYVDIFFMVNFMMDTILLLIVKKMILCSVSYGRILLGAATGAMLTCVVATGLPGRTYLQWILFYGVINTLMLKTGLRIRWGRELLKGWIFLYIASFLLGGIFLVFRPYLRVGSLFFLLAVLSYYLVQGIWKILLLLTRRNHDYCEVELYLGKQSFRSKALIDTGNTLRDMVSGQPVNVIERQVVEQLTAEGRPLRFRYIPYHSIGKKEGIMPLIRLDRMKIIEGTHFKWIEYPLAAISEERLSEENYQVILNPDILTGGKENGNKSSSSTPV